MKQFNKEEVYQLAQESFGIIPPMIKEIAEVSPAVAALYVTGVNTMEGAAFSDAEINAIELRISALNRCESCVKGHSFLSKRAGIGDNDIQAIISGGETSIQSLNRLLRATEALFYAGREGFDIHIDHFLKEEISRQEVFELIGLLSLKTISNSINNYLKAVRSLEKAI